MFDDAAQPLSLVASAEPSTNDLSADERRLIRNYRAVKAAAQSMLVDLSEQWAKTLPAERPSLRLVGPAPGR
jgi:hypothetical protein